MFNTITILKLFAEMSQCKLFSYFGRKRKEMEEMERENIAESTLNTTTMEQPPAYDVNEAKRSRWS